MNFSNMNATQLVSFYNQHSSSPVKRFSDRKSAERRCQKLLNTIKLEPESKVTRESMKSSLKLDRTIQCEETGEQWKNAHQMWVANPGYMTGGQQDRLTQQLYKAAKEGIKLVVKVNDLNFSLVNVEKKK